MKTIYPSDSEIALRKDEVTNLEKMLDTRFTNIASFLRLDEEQRTFRGLLESRSIIKVDHMDGSWNDYANYPLSLFPPLHMFITEDVANKTLLEFKVDHVNHAVNFTDWPDVSETFMEINDKLTDSEFMCLDASYPIGPGGLHSDEVWFLVPKALDIDELCSLTGYSATNHRQEAGK